MNEKIKKLCEVIGKSLAKLHKGDTASALWPFIPNEAEYYVGIFFIKDLYETIKKLKEKNYTNQQIAELLDNSSKIAQYFTLFHSAKILKPLERVELAMDLMEFLSHFRKDIFCEEGNNILNNPQYNIKYLNKNSQDIKLSNKLSALLLLYLEILYPTMMRMGHEFHGIYKEGDKKIFVKEFFNLNPLSLGIKENFPIKKIKIVEEVDGKIELDFFNHLFVSPKKISSYVEIDSKIVCGEDLKKNYNDLEEKIKKIIYKTNLYSRKDWFKVYAKGIFQSMKNLKDELNVSDNVPSKLFEKIENEDFRLLIDKVVEFTKNHTKEQIEEITKNSYLNIFHE